ncbi:hypothetical protein OYB40_23500, partial [Escherichia coli]|nr:hypothetical protein [Escherichia coli]
MSASPVVKTGEEAKYHLIQKNISKVGFARATAKPVSVLSTISSRSISASADMYTLYGMKYI